MKRMISLLMVLIFTLSILSGCSDVKTIDGITYDTYGLINESNKHNPDIKYSLVKGNVVWSIILVATLVAPFYFIGFDLFEPIRKKTGNEVKGQL